MKPFARINLSSLALRRGILVSSLAFVLAMVCGCMGNYAYYLERAGEYNSWEELRTAALECGLSEADDPGCRFWCKDGASSGVPDSLSYPEWLQMISLALVPMRFERIQTWEVGADDWRETILIRKISHEGLWPTGAIPAGFSADRRSVSCPDNNHAFICEKQFALEIARALYTVNNSSKRSDNSTNKRPAP